MESWKSMADFDKTNEFKYIDYEEFKEAGRYSHETQHPEIKKYYVCLDHIINFIVKRYPMNTHFFIFIWNLDLSLVIVDVALTS